MHHVILAKVIKNLFTFHTILNSFDKIRVYWPILNITCHQVLGGLYSPICCIKLLIVKNALFW